MKNINDGIYYVIGINKTDGSFDRTVVKFINSSNGINTYSDLRNMQVISAMAKGYRILTVNRCEEAKTKDVITSCEPFKPTLIDNVSGTPLNFEDMDDSTRKQTVGIMLSEFDKDKKKSK